MFNRKVAPEVSPVESKRYSLTKFRLEALGVKDWPNG
jgi:hypothetical protein